MPDDRLDGPDHDGFDAFVVGWDGPTLAGSSSGRYLDATGSSMCGQLASPARLDRRVEGLSRQYPPSIPGEGEADEGIWASLFASLARVAHWHGDQADGQKTGGRDLPSDGSRPEGARIAVVVSL